MAIVDQGVTANMLKTGEPLPSYQAPAPVPSSGQALAAGQTCKWYQSPVYTDTAGVIYAAPIGCEQNTPLLAGVLGGLALAAWYVFGRKKL